MIDVEKTIDKFGYSPESLTKGSNKRVVVQCDYCGNSIDAIFKLIHRKNLIVKKDCCIKCKHLKAADVNIVKYGVANQFQRKEAKKLSSEWIQSAEFKEKRDKTCVDKYGTVHPAQTKEIADKTKATVMEKYGVEYVPQSAEVREKMQRSNINKYGVKEFFSTGIAQQAFKDKHGVDNPFQLEEVKSQIKQTCMEKYGVEHHFKDPEKAKENAQKVLQSKIDAGTVKLYNGKSITELRTLSEYSDSRFRTLINKFGYEVVAKMTPRESYLESIFKQWLDTVSISYTHGKALGKYFPDFVIGGIIIELDGLYWHSDAVQSDNSYHFNKRIEYVKNGYRPLFFREDEIRDKFDIVKSITLNALEQCPNKFFARKLKVSEIDFSTSKEFTLKNHLMGPTNNVSASFGLFNGSDLISVLQMRRTKNNDYDIARFCSSLGTSIVGGFSRLLKAFIRAYSPDLISTFIDLRYGTGGYLAELGFENTSCYKSFQWTDFEHTYHRMKFKKNLGYLQNLNKIWDCGQARFEYNRIM